MGKTIAGRAAPILVIAVILAIVPAHPATGAACGPLEFRDGSCTTVNGALTDDSAVLEGLSGGGGGSTGGDSDGADDPIRCSSGCDTEA